MKILLAKAAELIEFCVFIRKFHTVGSWQRIPKRSTFGPLITSLLKRKIGCSAYFVSAVNAKHGEGCELYIDGSAFLDHNLSNLK